MAWTGLLGCFLFFIFRARMFYLPAAFAIGFSWALWMAHLKLADRLAPELEGRDIEVVGIVASLPAAGERSLRFEFEPESAEAKLPGRILLSWYRSPAYEEQPSVLTAPVHAGERWLPVVAETITVGVLTRGSVSRFLQLRSDAEDGRDAAGG